METKRMVWTMLALATYLGLFTSGTGPTLPVGAQADAIEATTTDDECVFVGTDGRVTIYPGDCVTTGAAPPGSSS